jgi:serine/threonine-protein kinase
VTIDGRVGTELGGYQIESVLGRGGMSVVYLARHLRLKRPAALKVLSPELAEDERFRERFIRESELAASLDHPSIVPIYEAGEADGLLYIAMRYVKGADLGALLRESGALSPQRTVDLLAPVADALDAAHAKGLVHRDVKPGNILIDPSRGSGREVVYLSDFGLTKRTASVSGLTRSGQFMGTVDYVAPEQVQGHPVDGRADQYSLGCLAFECLTGQPPFRKETEVAVLWAQVNEAPPRASGARPSLPRSLDRPVARAMAKQPDQRFRSCSAFVRALAAPMRAPTSAPTRAAEGEEAGEEVGAGRGRARSLAVVGVGAAVVAAAVAFVLTSGGGKPGSGSSPSANAPVQQVGRGAITIDPATNRVAAVTPVENAGGDVAVAGGFVWATDHTGISKIDPARNVVIGHIDGQYCCLEGSPDGVWAELGLVRVGGDFDSYLLRIDPTTNRVHRMGEKDVGIQDIEVVGDELWYVEGASVGDAPEDTLAVRVDLVSGDRRSYRTESPPGGCSFEGCPWETLAVGEGAVWFLNNTGTVTRLDPVSGEDQKLVVPGADGVAAGEGYVWVIDNAGTQVLQIDPDTLREIQRFPVGRDPRAIAVGEGAVWVVNRGDATISRIDPASGDVTAIPVGLGLGNLTVDETGVWVPR